MPPKSHSRAIHPTGIYCPIDGEELENVIEYDFRNYSCRKCGCDYEWGTEDQNKLLRQAEAYAAQVMRNLQRKKKEMEELRDHVALRWKNKDLMEMEDILVEILPALDVHHEDIASVVQDEPPGHRCHHYEVPNLRRSSAALKTVEGKVTRGDLLVYDVSLVLEAPTDEDRRPKLMVMASNLVEWIHTIDRKRGVKLVQKLFQEKDEE